MKRRTIRFWFPVVIVVSTVGAASLFFLVGGPPEKPPGFISVEEAIAIAKDHASQFDWYVGEETLELISAELWSVKREDDYCMIGDTKIIYKNLPVHVVDNVIHIDVSLLTSYVDDYDSPVIYLNKKVPDKIWVVKFSCEGYPSHWPAFTFPNQKVIRYKALLNAENGEILDRLYRSRPSVCGDEGFWEEGEGSLKRWPKTCPPLRENVVKILGRAENFTYPDFYFFTFSVEITSSVESGNGWEETSARCKIIGQVAELVENEPPIQRWVSRGSTAPLSIDWEKNPFVRIFGEKVGDNVVDAYVIDVEVENQFHLWYYKWLWREDF